MIDTANTQGTKMNISFTPEELAHIREALVIMRDIDAANTQKRGDKHDQDAELSAEIIAKIEGVS